MAENDGLLALNSDRRCSKFVKKFSNYSTLFYSNYFDWEGNKDFISLYFCFDHLILGVISLEDKVSLLS